MEASTDGGLEGREVSTDELDDAARYFWTAVEEDDPNDRSLLEAFGLMELTRVAARELGAAERPDGSPAARGETMGQVIDFNRAKLHLQAARSMEEAAPDAPPSTAASLRRLAQDFRERARGYPPMRG